MPYVESYVTLLLAVDTLPPFALNVTVYVFAVHCAVNVIFSPSLFTFISELFTVPLREELPPDRAHPLNVYPVRVGAGSVTVFSVYVT